MIVYFSDPVRRACYLESRSLAAAVAEAAEYRQSAGEAAEGGGTSLGIIIARTAARSTRESECKNTYDSDYLYYVDAGGWNVGEEGRASTNFALVSGKDILLCSWLNMFGDGAALDAGQNTQGQDAQIECSTGQTVQDWWAELSGGARAFLQQSQANDRGFVQVATRAPWEFTDPDDLVVILGDVHLRLRVGRPLDLFRYGEDLKPLDSELALLLDAAHSMGATTAQAGDMYETWESEILLRRRYRDLLELRDKNVEVLNAPMEKSLRGDLCYMINNHRVLTEMLFTDEDWTDWSNKHTRILSDAEVDEQSADFTDTGSIEAAIRKQHPELFPDGAGTLTQNDVKGNHDNNLLNNYWAAEFVPDHYRDHAELQAEMKASGSDTRPGDVRLGRDGCIWVEHGHKYDWHNNNLERPDEDRLDWTQEDHGFDTVVKKLVDPANDSDWEVNLRRGFGSAWTDVMGYEMRHFTLLRADELTLNEQGVSLVVQGHTHQACLLRTARGASFFWKHPHAKYYYDSKYCLDEAKEIAKGLADKPSDVE